MQQVEIIFEIKDKIRQQRSAEYNMKLCSTARSVKK